MGELPWCAGAVLLLAAAFTLTHHWYRLVWGHKLRWWAVPFSHGALLFGRRLERWERRAGLGRGKVNEHGS